MIRKIAGVALAAVVGACALGGEAQALPVKSAHIFLYFNSYADFGSVNIDLYYQLYDKSKSYAVVNDEDNGTNKIYGLYNLDFYESFDSNYNFIGGYISVDADNGSIFGSLSNLPEASYLHYSAGNIGNIGDGAYAVAYDISYVPLPKSFALFGSALASVGAFGFARRRIAETKV